jgi:hypothetical protein
MTKTKHVNKKASKSITKKRGTVLTILLSLVFLHAILATGVAYSTLQAEYAAGTSWVLLVLSLVSLADIVAAIGMWYWKKWAITLYAVTRVIAAAIHLMLTGSLLVVLFDLVPVSILIYVIELQSKRKLFE